MTGSADMRRKRERNRLRKKRGDPDYLAQQRASRAAQMRVTRRLRKLKGLCRECDKKAASGRKYCRKHLLYCRNRAR